MLSLMHSLTHSFTHSSIHSFILSLTHSLVHYSSISFSRFLPIPFHLMAFSVPFQSIPFIHAFIVSEEVSTTEFCWGLLGYTGRLIKLPTKASIHNVALAATTWSTCSSWVVANLKNHTTCYSCPISLSPSLSLSVSPSLPLSLYKENYACVYVYLCLCLYLYLNLHLYLSIFVCIHLSMRYICR